MARGGYIKLYRSIIDWEWFQDSNTYRLFTYLLMLANTEDKRWQGIDIKRGELVTSSESLAQALNLGREQVRNALKKLERSEITSKPTNKYTLICINNYDIYQAREEDGEAEGLENQPANQPTDNQQTTNNQPTTNQQPTTIKKHKKHKKQEEGNIPTPTPSEKPEKIRYAPRVLLTEEEHRKLCEKVSPAGAIRCIEILDAYKEAKGKHYASDYGAMRTWVIERYFEEQAKGPPGLKPSRDRAPAETQQQKNNRILDEMYAKAKAEEERHADNQNPDYPALEAHKHDLSG